MKLTKTANGRGTGRVYGILRRERRADSSERDARVIIYNVSSEQGRLPPQSKRPVVSATLCQRDTKRSCTQDRPVSTSAASAKRRASSEGAG